jgi:multidrug efflux pump subunit AcrB
MKAPHRGSDAAAEHSGSHAARPAGLLERFNQAFSHRFERLLVWYEGRVRVALKRPALVVVAITALFAVSLILYPFLGVAFFPRTDAGQFVMNVKAPSGSRIEVTTTEVNRIEALVRRVVEPRDLELVVSNIGLVPDFSALYTSNAGPHAATVQVQLSEKHRIGSYEYMSRMRKAMAQELPHLSPYFQSGGIVDAVLNQGLPAPIDVQLSGSNIDSVFAAASGLAGEIRKLPGVSDVYIPQDVDYPSLRLDIDRERAADLGLNQREVVDNVITALTSNQIIAPSFWVDRTAATTTVDRTRRTGSATSPTCGHPAPRRRRQVTPLDAVTGHATTSLNEIDHYQIRRVIDIYVNRWRGSRHAGQRHSRRHGRHHAAGWHHMPDMRGTVQGMQQPFTALGSAHPRARAALPHSWRSSGRSPIRFHPAGRSDGPDGRPRRSSSRVPRSTQSLRGVRIWSQRSLNSIRPSAGIAQQNGMPPLDAVVNSVPIRPSDLMTSPPQSSASSRWPRSREQAAKRMRPWRRDHRRPAGPVVLTVVTVPAAHAVGRRRQPAEGALP